MKENSTTILFVDDEVYESNEFISQLQHSGYRVLIARTASEAKDTLNSEPIALVVIDIMLPLGSAEDFDSSEQLAAHGGYRGGLVLAAWITQHKPHVKVVALSHIHDEQVRFWFSKRKLFYIDKSYGPAQLLDCVVHLLDASPAPPLGPVAFIVHGHDETAKLNLKNYLQNTLHLPEPIILHEQPSLGRTIIEKLEQETARARIAFVLLTPDDKGCPADSSDALKRRARQNVIFEMGYFLGRFHRTTGRVLLLHKGPLELPSDISGLIYIDISGGIEAAGELIRKELAAIQ
jgi:predicted nucleotide-binding protein